MHGPETNAVDEETVRREVGAKRRELAALLDGLREDRWDEKTLCSGWRVREVVAHVTMPFRMSMPRFALEMLRARGNMNLMADRRARRDAAAFAPRELVAQLADNADVSAPTQYSNARVCIPAPRVGAFATDPWNGGNIPCEPPTY